jgi:ribosomal protein S12 methylthiotransferase accessory factor
VSGLAQAAGFRHGLVHPLRVVGSTFAEPPGIVNVAVPDRAAEGWRTTAGGIARSRVDAEERALGEALERYAAAACALPRRAAAALGAAERLDLEDFSLYSGEQRDRTGFPHASLYARPRTYTNAYDTVDNRELWVPFELVGLSSDGAGVATSSGLAAGRTPLDALLRAIQELIERDALMVTWLHGVPGRRVQPLARHCDEVSRLGGEIVCIDATPDYSPHPVALVAGRLQLRGAPRLSLGAACRATWEDAVEKAYLEWIQGVVFVGYYRDAHPQLELRSRDDVRTFDDHAVYYSLRHREWDRIPLLGGYSVAPPADGDPSLATLVDSLSSVGIRVLYRELTTVDVRQAGLHVVRALSPELAPIHCDDAWPFLGGTVHDVERRYAWVDRDALTFPSPFPHPLG